MKVPKIFDKQPSVTKKDIERLEHCLYNWNRLHEILLTSDTSDDDLKRLLLIELTHKSREPIIQKLVGKITTRFRDKTYGNIILHQRDKKFYKTVRTYAGKRTRSKNC